MTEEKPFVSDHQELLVLKWHKASELEYRSHLESKHYSTLSDAIILDPAAKRLQDPSRLMYTDIEMGFSLDVGEQYNELAIGAIDLNAGSQVQGKFSFSYYRLFHLGKPVSEFYCKTCNNGLGHMALDKCDQCRPFARTMMSLERKIVGFTQLANGATVAEYMVSET